MKVLNTHTIKIKLESAIKLVFVFSRLEKTAGKLKSKAIFEEKNF